MSSALVLGNGKSRLKVPIFGSLTLYGCNAIYRDMTVDYLTAVDVKMQHEIYRSGYCVGNNCYFTDWDPMSEGEYAMMVALFEHSRIIENEKLSDRCIVGGSGADLYVTWLYEKDNVIPIENQRMSTGTTALDIAAQNHEVVFMAGFDIEQSDNIYLGSDLYENSYSLPEWYNEHEKIYRKYPNVEFIRVQCGINDDLENTLDNVQNYSIDNYLDTVIGE
jgi:hypothetical protein